MENALYFLIFLLVSITGYWFFVPKKHRSLFLFAVSFFIVGIFSIKYAFYFLLNIIIVYTAGYYINIKTENQFPQPKGRGLQKLMLSAAYKTRIKGAGFTARTHKKLILKLTLTWLIGNLVFFKYTNLLLDLIFKTGLKSSFISNINLPRITFPLGVSYVIFRLIHYIVETYRKNLPRSSFIDFALYVLFFPTFLAGPVDRFQRFQPQTREKKNIDIYNINYGLFRIICGLIKKFIIADNLAKLIMPVLYHPADYTRTIIIFCIYGLAIQIYLDFSGYTDIALGLARLFGYKIMENFKLPFFKKNIALFWRSWHISVYSWIRDYFFLPLFGRRASNIKIYLGMFLTMMVFMLWHKGNLNFFILGLYHGLGIITWHIFQEIKRKYPLLRKIVAKPYLTPFSIAATFTFVSFGFVFFNLNMHNIKNILDRIF